MMRLRLYFLFVLLGVSQVTLAESCHLGKVDSLHGNATVERDGRVVDVSEGADICMGDKYFTNKTSVLQLTFLDASKITIGKDSMFVVAKYEIYEDKPNVALFELIKGAFRAVTGTITQRPHCYEVKTALATLGVRGTDFWGGYGLTENGLDVVMLSGKGVYVTNTQGETVVLDANGLGTTVLPATAPSTPKIWKDAKVAKAIATITP